MNASSNDVQSGEHRESTHTDRSKIAHFIRVMCVPILLGWLALTVITNSIVPTLEKVGEAHTVGLNAKDAPSLISMRKIGSNFQEFDSDSNAMVLLEGDKPLGAEAHQYYAELSHRVSAALEQPTGDGMVFHSPGELATPRPPRQCHPRPHHPRRRRP